MKPTKPIHHTLRGFAALAGLAIVFTSISAEAAVYTWTGAAADGDWADAANWDANGIPVDTDTSTPELDQQAR